MIAFGCVLGAIGFVVVCRFVWEWVRDDRYEADIVSRRDSVYGAALDRLVDAFAADRDAPSAHRGNGRPVVFYDQDADIDDGPAAVEEAQS